MDPAEAAKTLAEALGHETDASARSSLASALSTVAGRMDPTEAARICGQAAKTLAEALGRETDANARFSLASALSTVAGRMEPAEAAQVCSDVIRIVLQERSAEPRDRNTRNAIDGIVAMLLPRLDRGAAHLCANELSMLMFAEADVNKADPGHGRERG